MKYLIWFLFIITITSIFLGVSIPESITIDFVEKNSVNDISNKLIGFGVIGLCGVVFPLFSYYRWKDKKISDYMLTQENLEKMREFNNSKES
jgi:Na+/H+ antiporter NhaD/arsenite permease-like protein